MGSALSRESGTLIIVLNIDEVNLHLLLCSYTNDKRRTLAGGDNLMREVHRLQEKTESPLKLLDDSLDQAGEAQVGVLVVDVLGELRNRLGISLGLKLEALALKQDLQFLVVCDDAIVDNREFPVGVGPVGGELVLHDGGEIQAVTYLWGWQLMRDGGPWVAHRVCAIPACESKTLFRS